MRKAVITGDIIGSTKLDANNRNWLSNNLHHKLKKWDKEFSMKSEIYRGDSYQCLMNSTEKALRVMLLIKTYIKSLDSSDSDKLFSAFSGSSIFGNSKNEEDIKKGTWIFDTRLAIGIGEIDKSANKIVISNGPAFQLSGRALDSIKDTKQTIAIATDDNHQEELQTELILLDAIMSKTTGMQCEVIHQKLLGKTEIEIAKLLNIAQSAVNQRSTGGNWNAIEVLVKRFEKIYSHG